MKLKKGICFAIALLLTFMGMDVKVFLHAQQTNTAKEILSMNFDNETVNDLSGLNNHGIMIGNVPFDDGVKGKAVHIVNKTGSSSQKGENYIDLGERIRLGKQDFTISFWYKSNSGNESGGAILGSKNYDKGGNRGFTIGSFTNEIRANIADGSSRSDLKFTAIDNTWHHSAVICERSGNMSVFTDGKKVSDTNIETYADVDLDDGHFVIGADGYGRNSLLDSYVDELHVYQGVLSADDIHHLYKEIKDQMEPDPEPDPANGQEVLYAAFDGNTNDSSKQGNDGEGVGDLSYVEGIRGKALHIVNENGSTSEKAKQYVNFGSDSSLKFGADDFSITYWYRSDNGVSAGGALISNKNFNNGANPGFNIGDFNNGFRMNFTPANTSRIDLYDIAAIDGIWHKVTINVDRDGNMISYYDGKQRKSTSIASAAGKSIDVSDFVVGADGYGKNGLNDAYIDELHVVKGLIEPAHIQQAFLKDKIEYELQSKQAFVDEAKHNSLYDDDKIAALEEAITRAKAFINSTDYDTVLAVVADLDAKLNDLKDGVEGIITGQMLYLNFDKENAEDATGRENHGRAEGISYVKGVSGKAAHIVNQNGSTAQQATSYIDFGERADLQFGSDNFAVAFWYKSENGGASEGALISNKDWASGSNPGLTIGNFTNGLRVNFTAENASRKDIYNIGANDDEWHYVVVNVDRDASMKAYVDQVLVNETNIADVKGKTIDVGDFVIGADGLKHYGMENVYMDEVRVFHRLMTEDEKASFYYPYKLKLKLEEMQDVLKAAENDPDISKDKIDALRSVVNDIRDQMDQADHNELQAMIRRLAMAYDQFIMSDEAFDLTFDVLSDVHIEGTDPAAVTNAELIDALEDIAILNPKSAALMIPGDITNGGSSEQYKGFFDIIDEYATAQPVIALGNHDVRWLCSSEDRNEAGLRIPTCKAGTNPFKERYLSRNQKYMGDTPVDQLYFDKWINGYHFITLNTEEDLKDQAYLSAEQLQWLDKTLAEQADPDKPIFLQLHQTFEGTADHEELDIVGGESEAQLKAIMSKYPQCVIFTGHVHNGVDMMGVYQSTWGHLVDVPCFWYSSYGSSQAQVGFQINVQGTNVTIRPRDFKNDKWMPDYDMSFDIHDPIPADPSDDSHDLSLDGMSAQAGSEQAQTGNEGPAANVLDQNENTIWHTNWDGAALNDRYITINLAASTKVNGLRYLPRQIGSNGIIQSYEIYISNDFGKTYEKAIEGTWKANANWKLATFKECYATNIKLVAVNAIGSDLASAAEIRITKPQDTMDDVHFAKTLLKSAIDKANAAEASGQLDILAPAAAALIKTNRDLATIVLNDPNASVEQCLQAWSDLSSALHWLDFKADKKLLKALIDKCEKLNMNDYKDGIKAFQAALLKAKEVYQNDNVLQDTIDNAYKALEVAKDGLVEKDLVDTTLLQRLIQMIDQEIGDGSAYKKDENWNLLNEALKTAKELLDKKDISEQEIKAAISALTNAFENIRLLPSEEQLNQLQRFVKIAYNINRTLYTKEQLKEIDALIDKANALLKDFDSTTYIALEDKLIHVLNTIKQVEGNQTLIIDNGVKNNTMNTMSNPNTSDATNTMAILFMLSISAGCLCFIRRRKHHYE